MIATGIFGAALLGLGAAQAAYQGFRGSQQSDLLRQNAAITEANAPYVRAAAREKARQLQTASYLMQGRQRSGYAASGLAVGGSVFDVMEDTARNYTRDASFAILEGELQARGMKMQADYFRTQARSVMRDAIVGGLLNFGSTAITASAIRAQTGSTVLGGGSSSFSRLNTGVSPFTIGSISDPFR